MRKQLKKSSRNGKMPGNETHIPLLTIHRCVFRRCSHSARDAGDHHVELSIKFPHSVVGCSLVFSFHRDSAFFPLKFLEHELPNDRSSSLSFQFFKQELLNPKPLEHKFLNSKFLEQSIKFLFFLLHKFFKHEFLNQ